MFFLCSFERICDFIIALASLIFMPIQRCTRQIEIIWFLIEKNENFFVHFRKNRKLENWLQYVIRIHFLRPFYLMILFKLECLRNFAEFCLLINILRINWITRHPISNNTRRSTSNSTPDNNNTNTNNNQTKCVQLQFQLFYLDLL